jgi:hypothetical protein
MVLKYHVQLLVLAIGNAFFNRKASDGNKFEWKRLKLRVGNGKY